MGMSPEEISKILKQAREKKKYTQAEVAEKAGLNTNYYASVERGEVNISIEKLDKIFNVLNIKTKLILP